MVTQRTLLALLLALVASTAHAAGVALRWNACFGDGGASNRDFACNTNNGSENLLATFILPAAVSNVQGSIATLELASAAPTVPAWWQFINAGTCRQFSIVTTQNPPAGAVACTSWDSGQGVIGIGSYVIGSPAANDVTIVAPLAVAVSNRVDLVPGSEYITARFVILHTKTVGFGSCDGCEVPACVLLKSVDVGTATGTAITLTAPANGTDANVVTWQGGGGVPALPGGACAGATPTRNATWGEVKAIYR